MREVLNLMPNGGGGAVLFNNNEAASDKSEDVANNNNSNGDSSGYLSASDSDSGASGSSSCAEDSCEEVAAATAAPAAAAAAVAAVKMLSSQPGYLELSEDRVKELLSDKPIEELYEVEDQPFARGHFHQHVRIYHDATRAFLRVVSPSGTTGDWFSCYGWRKGGCGSWDGIDKSRSKSRRDRILQQSLQVA